MSKHQIVIVTNKRDFHTDDVILKLQEMGCEPIRFNTDDIPLNMTISLGMAHDTGTSRGYITIQDNGRVIDVEAIRSVWWRHPQEFRLPLDLDEQEREFANGEIKHTLRSLWSSLDCYWISYPEYIRQASWKGNQLQRAVQLGFEVPRTLITTDPEEARAFYDVCNGQIIFKVLSDPSLGAAKISEKHPERGQSEPYMTYTTLVKSYHLNFSALDLILTPDGRYVFIENNPNGQFIFIEKHIPELRMTEALATCLMRGANSSNS